MAERVAIVNYGMGNLRSVMNACEALGIPVSIAHTPGDLDKASHIILPGVGAFADAMQYLRDGGWVEPLYEQVFDRKKPFLGICLGMQLLMERSEEGGDQEGLGWFKGAVKRLPDDNGTLRIPHVGWNDVHFEKRVGAFAQSSEEATFYFVHSFAVVPDKPDEVAGWCEYGQPFAAALCRDHVYATQFHPEKSQRDGLAILRGFAETE